VHLGVNVPNFGPGTDWPNVPHDGPALYEEARAPVDGYYT
jgi:hypothetical protein